MAGVGQREGAWGRKGCCEPFFHRPFSEFGLLGQLTGPASPTHISKSSFVGGLGAGLFTAWADPDHGWDSDVSGDAPF
jgi:hypothetical protein